MDSTIQNKLRRSFSRLDASGSLASVHAATSKEPTPNAMINDDRSPDDLNSTEKKRTQFKPDYFPEILYLNDAPTGLARQNLRHSPKKTIEKEIQQLIQPKQLIPTLFNILNHKDEHCSENQSSFGSPEHIMLAYPRSIPPI